MLDVVMRVGPDLHAVARGIAQCALTFAVLITPKIGYKLYLHTSRRRRFQGCGNVRSLKRISNHIDGFLRVINDRQNHRPCRPLRGKSHLNGQGGEGRSRQQGKSKQR